MLRIETRLESPTSAVIALIGNVDEAHAESLRDLVAGHLAAGREVTLDLRDLGLVRRDSVEYLCHGEGRRVKLLHPPAYLLNWLKCAGRAPE